MVINSLISIQPNTLISLLRENNKIINSGSRVTTFERDNDGLPTKIISTDATVTQTFDELGRLKTSSSSHVPGVLTNVYNTRGLRSNIRYQVGAQILLNVSISYDERKLPIRMVANLGGQEVTWERFWDELGRPETDILSNGMKVERRFDDVGRLTYLSNEVEDRPISRFEYTHNPVGTISGITKTFTRPEHNDVGRYVLEYGYDNLDRLTFATGDGNFQYDQLGNQLQRGGQFNELNQILEDAEFNYQYSTNGNLTIKTSKADGERIEYSWDNENKLTQTVVKNADGSIKRSVLHKYDGLNRRTQKIENGAGSSFAYDGEDIVVEFGDSGTIDAIYLHGPGIDDPIAMVRDVNGDGEFSDNELFFYAKDHLNSVHSLTDKTGKPVQRYNYSAYGKTKIEKLSSSDKLVKSPYGYTSREWDEVTGDFIYPGSPKQ